MTYQDPLSTIAPSASGASSTRPSEVSATAAAAISASLASTSSALDIRPDVQKLTYFKRELVHHAALDNWIRIDGAQAIGVLEHGRFESRFAPLARFAFAVNAPRERNSPTDTAHAEFAVEASKTPPRAAQAALSQERIGWRANLLAYDRTAILVSSAAMFASIRQSTLLISLDRMTRAMHSINFFSSEACGLLFLPVHEGLLLNVRHDHGQYFAALLLSLRINPAKVVIEIPGVFATQTSLLAQLVASYHRYGFKVAINLPEGLNLAALPLTSKPEFLLTDVDPEQSVAAGAAQRAAQTAALAAEQSALVSLAKFTRHYGATLVARAAV